MFQITRTAPDRIDIVLSGAIDAESMRMALDDLVTAAADITRGRILYTIPETAWPTIGALGVQLGQMPALLGLLGKFERCAVLSDVGWIAHVSALKGAVLPGIEVRGFALSDRAEAETWLAQNGDSPA